MKRAYGLVGLVCIVALLLAGISLATAQDDGVVHCQVDFEATVHVGPDAGLALVGTLALDSTQGDTSGTLELEDGTVLAVVGQVNGRAISLAIETADGQYIWGTGLSWNDFASCMGEGGGTFTGPQSGDLGDWGYAIGG